MNIDEALRRVRDPHEVLQLTDVELTEAAVTLAVEVERLRAALAEMDGHRAVLAERCYRKDLELDELRIGRG